MPRTLLAIATLLLSATALAEPTTELLTIRTAQMAMGWDDTVRLADLGNVTEAAATKSKLSIEIDLTYQIAKLPFAECTAFAWFDFDGNAVTCDECREEPPPPAGGTACACPSAKCSTPDGKTRVVKQP